MSPVRFTVSVVIPAHNAARFLGEAIESVLRQTLEPSEVIVVDDGSTDDTSTVARSFGSRVSLVSQANAGPAAARNTGVRRSSGELVAFQDADDLWLPTKLATQVAHLEAHPDFAAVYTDLSEIDAMGSVLVASKFALAPGAGAEGSILGPVLVCGFVFMQTMLVKRSVFQDVGYFDESFGTSEDRDFAIRMAARLRLGCIRQVLTQRRRHDGNLSNRFMDCGLRTDILALEKAVRQVTMDESLAARARSHLAELHLRIARFDLGRADGRLARSALLRAASLRLGLEPLLLLPVTFAPPRLLAASARARATCRNKLRRRLR